MQLHLRSSSRSTQGNILLLVLIMLAISLFIASGLFRFSSGNARLNARNNDYYSAVGAAEAATEKVVSQVTADFRNNGIGYVGQQISNYVTMIPSAAESPEWRKFTFMDLSGHTNRLEVDYLPSSGFVPLAGQYGPLRAFKDRLRILCNVRPNSSLDGVVGSVYQDIELTRIPIFQYAVFYNVILEFTPMPAMTMTGPVHCNTNIYCNPYGVLTFNSDVTSSGSIVMGINPASPTMPALGGATIFNAAHDSGVSTLNLPIGTNNSPAAVHQVLEVPPGTLPSGSEDPQSSLGQQRYYNKADIIITAANNSLTITSGRWNSFATTLSTNEVSFLVSTNKAFFNKRENKTVKPVQIDVAKLVTWNATNGSIRPGLPNHNVSIIYVNDQRTFTSAFEPGVRLVNGTNLPPLGLTVATADPLYVQGHYNCPASALGTTNTSGTVPASVAGDAI